MRESNFATEKSIVEAYEGIKNYFEGEVEELVKWDMTVSLNRLLQVDA